ncbi:phosphoglycerate kinase [Rhodoplanes serenus]|uniref:Phosphoglycerate kinase n=1 Tax=Rhodoplanes serenus TaxID=200615 RepID=A0A9X4XMR9_9BRAD|nr:phosphoglycerate kinase [Rhodoplanes serenus]MBI5114701.1 phosphoglycerate kinase [Rhodovulum sp.]MTW18027.1 phosphoglycerate kinase [Rhodoplanes serenus]
MTAFRTLDQADVKDKRVLVRLDLNVPTENGKVTDVTRIERAAPTITELADKGAKVILLSHFGRPKGGPDPKYSLAPVAQAVGEVIGRPVGFAADCIGAVAEQAVAAMKPGDVLCLENTRFHKEEEKNDPAFVKQLAQLGDVWVNDAFSAAHRAHASTEGLGHVLPAYAGRSMQAELEALTKALEQPKRPVAAVVGGAKVSGKLDLLGNLLDKVDVLIIGGGMANTFLAAQGHPVGKSLCEPDLIPTANEILAKAQGSGKQILLPVDAVVAETFAANAPSRVAGLDDVGPNEMILDIGPRSVEHVVSELERLKTVLWNGPFGAFELTPFDTGTVTVAEAAAELTAAGKLVTVAGGGDTVAALNHAGAADRFTYISTAGGAFLEWLEGKALPGVDILKTK